MKFKETSKQALYSLWSNKLRSVLTLIAVTIGVFAIIGSSTAVLVIDSYFKETLSLMGGDVFMVRKYPNFTSHRERYKYRNRKDITFEVAEKLEKYMKLGGEITPSEGYGVKKISYEDEETEPNVFIRGSNQYFVSSRSYIIEEGRNINSEDLHYARSVAIIGSDVKETLFGNISPIGKYIKIDGGKYRVIASTEKRGNVFGRSLDNYVLIPYTKLIGRYGGKDRNISIYVKAPGIEWLSRTIDEVTGILRTIRKVPPGEENDFNISSNDTFTSIFDRFINILLMGGIAIGFISLLGAGIGVMNIMLVSVTERTREIGIRKAIGATKGSIVRQFLTETIIICQIGAFMGIIIGIIVANIIMTGWLGVTMVVPWNGIIAGLGTMLAVGLIFGVYPAFKASKLDPIICLNKT